MPPATAAKYINSSLGPQCCPPTGWISVCTCKLRVTIKVECIGRSNAHESVAAAHSPPVECRCFNRGRSCSQFDFVCVDEISSARHQSIIMPGVIIRGELQEIRIGRYCVVGEGTVIRPAYRQAGVRVPGSLVSSAFRWRTCSKKGGDLITFRSVCTAQCAASKSAAPREGSLIYRCLGWARHGPVISTMRLSVQYPEPFTMGCWIPFQ